MSLQLHVAIDNARHQLEQVVPAFAAGRIFQPRLPHGLGILFRQLGTCRLLLEGVATPMLVGQMQAAGVYLHGLRDTPDSDKVTSLAACWWDAIAAGYWEAARQIAALSRTSHNPDCEHEDDFLYIWFLMSRYCQPEGPEVLVQTTIEEKQASMLERWERVLDGAPDMRLDLCRALISHDTAQFQATLGIVADERQARLDAKHAQDKITDEDLLWLKPIWPQGLALIRLAEREGMGADYACAGVPDLIRVAPQLRFDPDAWRTIDYLAATR